MTVPETMKNLMAASPLVIEGKVRSQQGVWDADKKNIYTINEIEIFKIFQGNISLNTVNIVTRGGVVDLEMDWVSNALELGVGDMGLFMLEGFPITLPMGGDLYRPTEGVLGFIRYDLVIGEAQGVYDNYSDIETVLYGLITDLPGISIFDVGPWDSEDAALSGEPSVERSMVSEGEGGSNATFEVHAGVGDLLTLIGTDFGSDPGSVLFPDANSGGRRYISALPDQIKEWSDERIVLEVPYRAGTGKVRIDKANGESVIGAEDLPIGYDHINVQYTDDTGRKSYETQLISNNGRGGYDFQFQSDFAQNPGASAAFRSLIETWGCTTGVNFQIGEVTDVDEDASDGINIVRFDNGDELGGRTLAYARSRYRGCFQGGTIKWFVNEIEVVVNDGYDWYYGDGVPGPSQFDFETVMLHEIGHTQQLGHVINENEVMHFAVKLQNQKRSLSHIDTIGGVFVTDKSIDEAVCGRVLMEHHGECCETMAVVGHPSDKTLCPDETTAVFSFAVDFADVWQWQVKNGEIWTDLTDDATYSGSNTAELTVAQPSSELLRFRCVASTICEASLTSNTASFIVRRMEFSLTSMPATCDTDGQIDLDRNTVQGSFRVSTDGGTSFDSIWNSEDTKLSISVSPGFHSVLIKDDQTGCVIDLGKVEIPDAIALQLSAEEIQKTGCSDGSGSIKVEFNDHPDYVSVLLSMDGGASFESFEDAFGTAVFDNLENGSYSILGMWEDNTCVVTADAVSIKPILLPEATVEITEADCEGSNGAFLLEINPRPDFDEVEISVDGGNTFPYLFSTTSEENKIMGLSADTYDLRIRWAGASCVRSLGIFTVQKTMPENGNCSDTEDTETPSVPEAKEDPEIADTEDGLNVALKLYPNPTSERIYVKVGEEEILKFRLFSTNGSLVQEMVPQRQNGNTFLIDVAHLQAGVYTIHILTEKKIILKQFIIN